MAKVPTKSVGRGRERGREREGEGGREISERERIKGERFQRGRDFRGSEILEGEKL